jgi:hypothetical protein
VQIRKEHPVTSDFGYKGLNNVDLNSFITSIKRIELSGLQFSHFKEKSRSDSLDDDLE